MTVPRVQIADCVARAFVQPPASRADLVEAASTVGARAEVLAVVQALPERQYTNLRELWPYLAEVPIAH